MSAIQVETYEVEEVNSDLEAEEDGEYLAMVDRLKLDGQKKLINPDTKEVSPYRKMTDEEFKIFKILFPTSVTVEQYSSHKIPVRVLQVYQHARSLNLYTDIFVWDESTVEITDPVLVGRRKASEYSYSYDILARWGSALAPIEKLKEFANKKAAAFLSKRLEKIKNQVKTLEERKDAFDIVGVCSWNGGFEDITIAGIHNE